MILHGCTIKDRVLIGMGAIIMDGVVIGEDSVVGAGALVTGGTVAAQESCLGVAGKSRQAGDTQRVVVDQRIVGQLCEICRAIHERFAELQDRFSALSAVLTSSAWPADPYKTDRITNQGRRIVLSLDEIRNAVAMAPVRDPDDLLCGGRDEARHGKL